ncbi:hypothetical protein KKG48_04170 [Patescibacteria group bacterium]|nr:hypothetical protein [Patescibacteria group bacterium]
MKISNGVNKKFLIGLVAMVAVLIIAVAGYWCYQYYQKTNKVKVTSPNAIEQAGSVAENLSKQASQGVLPEINPQSNPMENAPDTNPMSKTNPFSDIKTNPF